MCHLRVGFAQVTRRALAAAEQQARANAYMPPRWLDQAMLAADTAEQQNLRARLSAIEQREQAILTQAFFTAESSRLTRTGKRLLSLVTGREHRLLTELNVLHSQRLTVLEQLLRARNDDIAQRFDRRLALLETLWDYEYR
jgi:hypothetical protein